MRDRKRRWQNERSHLMTDNNIVYISQFSALNCCGNSLLSRKKDLYLSTGGRFIR
jgi:hypothetical protein